MNLQMRDFLHLMSLMRSVIKIYPLQMTVDSMSRSIWGKAAAGDRGPRRGASAESEEGGRAQGWRAKIVIVMIHEVLGEMWIFNEVEGIFSNKMCECERLTTSYVLYRATQQVAHDLLLKGIQKLRFLPLLVRSATSTLKSTRGCVKPSVTLYFIWLEIRCVTALQDPAILVGSHPDIWATLRKSYIAV